MLKTIATLTAVTFLSLAGPEARACDKEKKHAAAASAQPAPDPHDAQVLAKGERTETIGTATCSTSAPGPRFGMKPAARHACRAAWPRRLSGPPSTHSDWA